MQLANQKQTLVDALMDAFRRPAELEMVVSNADLGTRFVNFLAAPGTTYDQAVFNLVDWVESRNLVIRFLQAAIQANSGNPKLQAFYRQFLDLSDRYNLLSPNLAIESAEAIVLPNVTIEQVGQWLDRMNTMRRAICRIEPQPESQSIEGYGTGFLVAPNIVMTCFHVVSSFWSDPSRANNVRIRFDYERGLDGSISRGTEVALLTTPAHVEAPFPWQCFSSPTSKLDIALLRLSSLVESKELEGTPREPLKLVPRQFRSGDPILILQHPMGTTQGLAFGAVNQVSSETQVLYDVNTQPGSSGSPCLTQDLKVTGIHRCHAGIANGGVPFTAVLPDLQMNLPEATSLGLLGNT
ncbi:hypothetical protein Pan97_24120 [Bremerella volcania]|uniref:Serine protease n=1 Tax=Bremerella volcania TaxID=2527984 RepID=A0A518C853_9BACT|nr:trypsin-like peptidase domain-containing protein [Bremerella volcania]QDU75382.1 hypothetical protein Pan97_24120 [Bremerella volcania]